MRRVRASDSGFTLIELLLAVVILGIIVVPLGNFMISYFSNYTNTEVRLSESHDAQIAAAFISQDVANLGVHDTAYPTFATQQSVWTGSDTLPGSYCGKGLGQVVLLLQWDDWSVSGGTGSRSIHSAAYLSEAGSTLHRVYCSSGSTATSETTVVHNYVYPDSTNTAPVTCQATTLSTPSTTACSAATLPAVVNFKLSIRATGDTTIWQPTLNGQRRQT